jgi:hypothetical protein
VVLLAGLSALALGAAEDPAARGPKDRIRLLVRADDMGCAHAVNEAVIRTVEHGVARSVEVIVPGPWFREAARMLRERPGIDVGVHLTLTSEWDLVKWGPIAQNVPSLVDREGKFRPMTRERQGFPPDTGFLESGYKIAEVERELRAQIELARRELPGLSHLSAHMGTATAAPELSELVERLAAEHKLPLRVEGLRSLPGGLGGARASGEEKERRLVEALERLEPGDWLLVEHPGLDTPEMRAMGHVGYENVAEDRAGVTRALTSEKVRAVIERRGIELVSYADLLRGRTEPAAPVREESR